MANEQYGFFVDSTRCIKCWACEIGCKQWHGIDAGTVSRRKVEETVEGTFPAVKRHFTSLSCMHCESPACVAACPTGALSKREEDGIVVGDNAKCIGCGTCAATCPFEVPKYRSIEGEGGLKMDKCDTCLSLGRQNGEDPHCVATCPLQALHFDTLTNLETMATEKGGKRMEGPTGPSVFLA